MAATIQSQYWRDLPSIGNTTTMLPSLPLLYPSPSPLPRMTKAHKPIKNTFIFHIYFAKRLQHVPDSDNSVGDESKSSDFVFASYLVNGSLDWLIHEVPTVSWLGHK